MKKVLALMRWLTRGKHPDSVVVLEYDPHPRLTGQWVGPSPCFDDHGEEVRWMPVPNDAAVNVDGRLFHSPPLTVEVERDSRVVCITSSETHTGLRLTSQQVLALNDILRQVVPALAANNSLTVGGTPYRAGTGSQEDRT
jgi:hypothetical protein